MRPDQIVAAREAAALEELITESEHDGASQGVLQILTGELNRQRGQVNRQTRSMQTLAREALAVQDACNLSGVALALFNLCRDLRELGDSSTTTINQHPLVRLFVNKLVSLAIPGAEIRMYDEFSKDYDIATREAA